MKNNAYRMSDDEFGYYGHVEPLFRLNEATVAAKMRHFHVFNMTLLL